MTDPSVSLDAALKIIEILSILGGGGVVTYKFGRMSEKVEAAITVQGRNIVALQDDVRKLNELVTSVALQGQRLDTHDRRIDLIEQRWEDLRRGEGYVLPLERSFRAKPPRE